MEKIKETIKNPQDVFDPEVRREAYEKYVQHKVEKKERRRERWKNLRSKFDPILEPLRPAASQRHEYSVGEMWHYWAFWSGGACVCGGIVGMISFSRRRKYRQWVLKQPKEKQMEIMSENSMTSARMKINDNIDGIGMKSGMKSSKYLQSRFSTLPKSMDTRAVLPYSGDYRPSQWFEFGALKYLNQRGNYPWASELWAETCKWGIRIGLMAGITLGFEIMAISMLKYELGKNLFIRGIAGGLSAFTVSRLASEGRLFWYQSLYLGIGFGIAMTILTYYDPYWAEKAKNNRTIVTYSWPYLDKSFKKREKAQYDLQQVKLKWLKDHTTALQEQIAANPDSYNDLSWEDKLFVGTNWQDVAKANGWTLDEEIDVMSYEELKQLHIKSAGDEKGVNYDRFPFKYFKKELPQWYILNAENFKDETNTKFELENAQQSLNLQNIQLNNDYNNIDVANNVSPILVT